MCPIRAKGGAAAGVVDPRRALGRLGEDIAAAHIERMGFTVLARNHRTRFGEIDLVAFDGRVLAFVEVKTRRLHHRVSRPDTQTRRGPARGDPARDAPTRDNPNPTRDDPTRDDPGRDTPRGGAPGRDAPATSPLLAATPLHGLRFAQRRRLRKLAVAWLQVHSPVRADEIRFDAVGIVVDANDRLLQLDHIEGAW